MLSVVVYAAEFDTLTMFHDLREYDLLACLLASENYIIHKTKNVMEASLIQIYSLSLSVE